MKLTIDNPLDMVPMLSRSVAAKKQAKVPPGTFEVTVGKAPQGYSGESDWIYLHHDGQLFGACVDYLRRLGAISS